MRLSLYYVLDILEDEPADGPVIDLSEWRAVECAEETAAELALRGREAACEDRLFAKKQLLSKLFGVLEVLLGACSQFLLHLLVVGLAVECDLEDGGVSLLEHLNNFCESHLLFL